MQNLNILLIQSDIIWENAEMNRLSFEKSIIRCKDEINIICLPEMFTTGFSANPKNISEEPSGKSVEWMHKMAEMTGKTIVGSIVIKENKSFYNRLYWINPDHSFYFYNKKHLFAYGNEHLNYSSGNQRIIIPYHGWNILVQICYDLRFPVWSRNRFLDNHYEYDLILYVANWPSSRVYQWKQLLIARAIENQCYVAGVNRIGTDGNQIEYSGCSLIIDPKGNTIEEAAENQDQSISASIKYNTLIELRNRFPFAKDWDRFNII